MIYGGVSREHCISIHLFSKKVAVLVKGSGLLYTALYLKQCSSSLQIAYGGDRRSPGQLPTPISLTRSGYPTIIPTFHRQMMYRKDDKADKLVQFYLSFFTLYRVVDMAVPISRKTFDSIVSPVNDIESVRGVLSDIK